MRKPFTGDVAQLGERRLCKPEVDGSIPFISTMPYKGMVIHVGLWRGEQIYYRLAVIG